MLGWVINECILISFRMYSKALSLTILDFRIFFKATNNPVYKSLFLFEKK